MTIAIRPSYYVFCRSGEKFVSCNSSSLFPFLCCSGVRSSGQPIAIYPFIKVCSYMMVNILMKWSLKDFLPLSSELWTTLSRAVNPSGRWLVYFASKVCSNSSLQSRFLKVICVSKACSSPLVTSNSSLYLLELSSSGFETNIQLKILRMKTEYSSLAKIRSI